MIDVQEVFGLMLRSMRATAELTAQGAPDSRTLKLDGVTAGITPATPNRSVLNGVIVEDFAKLERVLDDLAAAYAAAGVRAWTVWVPEYESHARELLGQAGHVLDATPAAMLLDLDALREPAGPKPDSTTDWDIEAAGSISDAAYGDPHGLFAQALGDLPPDAGGHMYLAHVDGRPASFVVVHDHEDNCEFWMAATIPEARDRGLVSQLLHRALVDARDRGCATSTTQATKMGEPVYARLGYERFGTIEMWERRR